MTILLRRNSKTDPWYSVHGNFIEKGEIVKLDGIVNENSSKEYPAEIYVIRNRYTGDTYHHKASLICFDYVVSKS